MLWCRLDLMHGNYVVHMTMQFEWSHAWQLQEAAVCNCRRLELQMQKAVATNMGRKVFQHCSMQMIIIKGYWTYISWDQCPFPAAHGIFGASIVITVHRCDLHCSLWPVLCSKAPCRTQC